VKIGIQVFVTDETLRPDDVATLVEDHEFESLWFPDHTHLPSQTRARHPLVRGEIPRVYARNLDVFVALTAAALATRHLKVGTGICILPQRDPILTAKTVASIDHLSGGRLLFGVGAGWNLEEMQNHGVDPVHRFGLLRDHIGAMKAIWRDDVASFDGRYTSFNQIMSWPKPAQRPWPALLLGANGPRAIQSALEVDADWLPGRHKDHAELVARVREFRARSEGRLGVTLSDPYLDRGQLSELADAGAERAFFPIQASSRDDVERRLGEIRKVVDGGGITASTSASR
jgi:probable F420-dependent oxidoreductase